MESIEEVKDEKRIPFLNGVTNMLGVEIIALDFVCENP